MHWMSKTLPITYVPIIDITNIPYRNMFTLAFYGVAPQQITEEMVCKRMHKMGWHPWHFVVGRIHKAPTDYAETVPTKRVRVDVKPLTFILGRE